MVKLAKKFKMALMMKTKTLSPPPGHSVGKAYQKEEHNVDVDDDNAPCLMSKPTKKATCMAVHQAVIWTAQVILCMVVRVGGGEVAL